MHPSVQKLIRRLPPPREAYSNEGNWDAVEAQIGSALPSDYKQFVARYGKGDIGSLPLMVATPFSASPRFNLLEMLSNVSAYAQSARRSAAAWPYVLFPCVTGILPFATTGKGDTWAWLCTADDPDAWGVLIFNARDCEHFEYPSTSFVDLLLALLERRVKTEPMVLDDLESEFMAWQDEPGMKLLHPTDTPTAKERWWRETGGTRFEPIHYQQEFGNDEWIRYRSPADWSVELPPDATIVEAAADWLTARLAEHTAMLGAAQAARRFGVEVTFGSAKGGANAVEVRKNVSEGMKKIDDYIGTTYGVYVDGEERQAWSDFNALFDVRAKGIFRGQIGRVPWTRFEHGIFEGPHSGKYSYAQHVEYYYKLPAASCSIDCWTIGEPLDHWLPTFERIAKSVREEKVEE